MNIILYCGLAIEVFAMGYAMWIIRTYRDKLVSGCAEARRKGYATGYQDGACGYAKGGSK